MWAICLQRGKIYLLSPESVLALLFYFWYRTQVGQSLYGKQSGTEVSFKLHFLSEDLSLWVMRRGSALNSLTRADSEQNPVRSCRESSVASLQGRLEQGPDPGALFIEGWALADPCSGLGKRAEPLSRCPWCFLKWPSIAFYLLFSLFFSGLGLNAWKAEFCVWTQTFINSYLSCNECYSTSS